MIKLAKENNSIESSSVLKEQLNIEEFAYESEL